MVDFQPPSSGCRVSTSDGLATRSIDMPAPVAITFKNLRTPLAPCLPCRVIVVPDNASNPIRQCLGLTFMQDAHYRAGFLGHFEATASFLSIRVWISLYIPWV